MFSRALPALLICAALTACAAPKRLDRHPSRLYTPPPPIATTTPAPLPALPPPPPAALPQMAYAPAPQPQPPPRNAADLRQAQEALQQSYQYTGLTDAQLTRQKAAEALIVQGDGSGALDALTRLNNELKNGTKSYVVKSGDSLWVISGKPEIYGNPWLWPLIWQSNIQVLPNPDVVAAGQQLRIRPNPTIQEVVDAVDYARKQSQRSQTRVGEIKEAP